MTLRRRWVRSWPAEGRTVPDHHPHVIDDLPRLPICSYDLATNPACWTVLRDCTLLEWDIVLAPEAMHRWEQVVDQAPERLHVAPYRVYAGTGYAADGWQSYGNGESVERFGFGVIWFPAAVIDAFHRWDGFNPHAGRFTDGTFADWYAREYGPAVVAWEIEPVHLNYRVSVPPL